MKTIYLAIIAAVSALGVSVAHASDVGPYVQADIGLANLNYNDGHVVKVKNYAKSLKNSYKESSFMPRISAGYDFGAYRVAADYTKYKNIHESFSGDVVDGKNTYAVKYDSKLKVQSFGVSGIYDVPTQWGGFQPYVGARVSLNKVKIDATGSAVDKANAGNSAKVRADGTETKVGFGAMAGVNYKINDAMTVDAGYRYNRIYSDLSAHEATVGLRYSF